MADVFVKHQVDRLVPVENLVKCKMQDNLEFLQWMKRYWDQYFPGIDYDPVARRKASGGAPTTGAAGAPVSASSLRTSTAGHRPAAGTGARRPAAASNTAATRAPRTSGAAGAGGAAQTAALTQENNQLKETVEGLERERDFYFNKLRDIELLLQQEVEAKPEIEQEGEQGSVGKIQAILYSTEEGFEIPAEGEEQVAMAGDAAEEETF